MEGVMGDWPCDPKQHISDIVHHSYACGMRYLVVSPGSRNAPFIRTFAKSEKITILSIVDERCAAFVALGIANQRQEPVGLLCTSGSAPLNYAPALAEAYYQHVPLVVFSTDRPARLVNQQDSQTIDQSNLFVNYSKGYFQLPEEPTSQEELEQVAKIIGEAFERATSLSPGPVQINTPLEEPLYDGPLCDEPLVASTTIAHKKYTDLPEEFWQKIVTEWQGARKRMIVVGQIPVDPGLTPLLAEFEADPSVVIVAENLANQGLPTAVSSPDLQLQGAGERAEYAPDFLLSFGGHLVAKQLKVLLRNYPTPVHYRIDPGAKGIDTYHSLSQEIVLEEKYFFQQFLRRIAKAESTGGYKKLWQQATVEPEDEEFLVIKRLIAELPANSIVHLGNSMAVRHAQKLATRPDLLYHSNRGVAGIDGCLSTAVGQAFASDQLVLCILGDLTFLYDSNGLWNRDLPKNLRVVVLNNHGGDIFRRLPGPRKSPGYQDYFIADHPVDIGALVQAYGALHYACTAPNYQEITPFLAPAAAASVLEVTIDASHRDVLSLT